MIRLAVPVIRVSDADAAEAFYRTKLGFAKESEYRPGGDGSSDVYVVLARDGIAIHVSSFRGDGVLGSVTNFVVEDVDALFAELRGRGLANIEEPTDQDWNEREMHVRDPDGNKLRFVQAPADPS